MTDLIDAQKRFAMTEPLRHCSAIVRSGHSARLAEAKAFENPYSDATQKNQYRAWARGWRFANEEIAAEEERKRKEKEAAR